MKTTLTLESAASPSLRVRRAIEDGIVHPADIAQTTGLHVETVRTILAVLGRNSMNQCGVNCQGCKIESCGARVLS